MQLIDLEHALAEALKTGQLGVPVSLRIMAVTPQTGIELPRVIAQFAPLIRLISQESSGKVQARQHPSGQQLSVLWTDSQGRTVSITVASASTARPSLGVLVVGNHGITQLNGGEAWEGFGSPVESPLWEKEITESLKRGTSIVVGDS
ncbi:MAG: hypothetical protein KDA84_02695 [Planctomycetaceae bacterium]|nr:hypothetical protein [Planctomycetaceae bacterium]